ncbi:hypothetical protein [Frankia tisae]|uniref:hypothetical protein n=1 Tax=Frankia tisae TaxID=2950104 RepID=UPI0021BEDB1F|nr:hypothetical protein [Frankia tisae]
MTYGSRGPSRPSASMAATAAPVPPMISQMALVEALLADGPRPPRATEEEVVAAGRSPAGGPAGDDRWDAADGPSSTPWEVAGDSARGARLPGRRHAR